MPCIGFMQTSQLAPLDHHTHFRHVIKEMEAIQFAQGHKMFLRPQ